jgi:Zn-dependent peptidase ImmA (M78 family)
MSKNKLLQLEMEKKVSLFRSENGYSGTEPIRLASLLIKKNVITLFKPLSGLLSGMAIKANEDLRFMMINQNHTLGRQHFTIAHELYHLFVQEDFTSQKCITGLFDKHNDIEERKADFFAASLLLPESGVMQLIPDKEFAKKNLVSIETLFKIQHYFSVSLKSVIFRLCELELIERSYFETYSSGIKTAARRLGYDMSLYEPGNYDKTIGDYGTLANQLYDSKKISESYFYELMNAINIDPLAPIVNDNE